MVVIGLEYGQKFHLMHIRNTYSTFTLLCLTPLHISVTSYTRCMYGLRAYDVGGPAERCGRISLGDDLVLIGSHTLESLLASDEGEASVHRFASYIQCVHNLARLLSTALHLR